MDSDSLKKLESLKGIADGVRGSEGTTTIPKHQAEELKLKEVQELKNNSVRVSCPEFVAAVDAASGTSPKENSKPTNKPTGKPTNEKKTERK